ncbi:MAG: hypothetical protein ABR970_22585 [Roseiarcus sp.]|jgi:hypothetical protein
MNDPWNRSILANHTYSKVNKARRMRRPLDLGQSARDYILALWQERFAFGAGPEREYRGATGGRSQSRGEWRPPKTRQRREVPLGLNFLDPLAARAAAKPPNPAGAEQAGERDLLDPIPAVAARSIAPRRSAARAAALFPIRDAAEALRVRERLGLRTRPAWPDIGKRRRARTVAGIGAVRPLHLFQHPRGIVGIGGAGGQQDSQGCAEFQGSICHGHILSPC